MSLRRLTAILPFVFLAGSAAAKPAQRVTVVLRYDDYSSVSQTPFELELVNTCERLGLPLVIAVVPRVVERSGHDPSPQTEIPLSQEKIELLRDVVQRGLVEVAVHGYRHQTHPVEGRNYSEFAGRNYTVQRELIAQGKQLLEDAWGVPLHSLVPPWNTYDANTVRAAADAGIVCFSAAADGPTAHGVDMKYLPATSGIHELESAIAAARKSHEKDPIVTVLLHSYDAIDVNQKRGVVTMPELVDRLEWLAAQPDVDVKTMAAVAASPMDLSSARYESFSKLSTSTLFRIVPREMESLYYPHYYLSVRESRQDMLKGWALALVLYLSLIALSVLAGYRTSMAWFTRHKVLRRMAQVGAAGALVVLVVFIARDMQIYLRGTVLLVSALGLCSGVWVSMAKTQSPRASVQRSVVRGRRAAANLASGAGAGGIVPAEERQR